MIANDPNIQPAAPLKSPNASDENSAFRDHIATVDQKGKRIWIHPKKPRGRFYNARTWVSLFLLAVFFSGPFIRIGGEPLLLLNFLERKFVILGIVFWPQDFHLFFLISIVFIVFVLLFTAIFGRLWCGWACPQTIFMEMVFRKIEYLIEGGPRRQKKLNASPWTTEKILKKTTKHLIFASIAFLIGNLFMAYVVGSERLFEIISKPPTQNLAGFVAVVVFSGIFYFIFSWFREQACVIVCPYGRFQSVLLDQNSVVVSYDFKRGEKRGKISKKAAPPPDQGDCVDCHQCVDVCPTGIDIRNGTQLECVNCTACMDACDTIMTKINRPKGLIRYASYTDIVERKRRLLTPRTAGYSAVLLMLTSVFLFAFLNRSDVDVTLLRTPGTLFNTLENGNVTNLYNVKVVNKTEQSMPLEFRLKNREGKITLASGSMVVPQNGLLESVLIIELPPESLQRVKTSIEVQVFSGDRLLEEKDTSFMSSGRRR